MDFGGGCGSWVSPVKHVRVRCPAGAPSLSHIAAEGDAFVADVDAVRAGDEAADFGIGFVAERAAVTFIGMGISGECGGRLLQDALMSMRAVVTWSIRP